MKKLLAILVSVLLLATMIPLSAVSALSVVAAQMVTINTDITIAISTGGEAVDLLFIPPVSGVYTFEADSSYHDYDTYGSILDANYDTLMSDDDSGEGNNFLMEYYFTVGETYYLRSRFYESGRTGSFTVRVNAKEVESHEHVYDHQFDVFCNICNVLNTQDSIAVNTEINLPDNLSHTLDLVFVPQVSGHYVFTGDGFPFAGASETCVLNANGVVIAKPKTEHYDTSCSLTAGTPYVLRTYVYDSSLTVWISLEDADELEYRIRNGQVTIYGYNGTMPSEVIIPETIDGYPVTRIADRAFYSCKNLSVVSLPKSLTAIDTDAFSGCKALLTINYAGSEADGQNITIGINNDCLLAAHWNYNYTPESDFTYGDVDGNGNINNKDLALLQQYVNKWDVSINVAAADVNVDGAVNNKDLALLQQYINKWDVQLGK